MRDVSDLSLSRLVSLAGRSAVVTGAARGIGLAIARRLAEAGARVALADLDESAVAAAAATITDDFSVPCVGIFVDVADPQSVCRLADVAAKQLGGLEIWVNNAAIYPARLALEMSHEEWDRVFDVNLRGAFLGAREAATRMLASKTPHGVILNLASVSGFRGRSTMAAYTASKHGIVGLTKTLAIELGPRGIRVLGIAPTIVTTPGMEERRASAAPENRKLIEDMEQQIIARLPLGRVGVPDDVARVAVFCVSDLAAWMTGTTIPVDGGAMAS
jgi:NAD(P)-dependent dehydrogenase (short-subunit alcohol dehydrogenase family)